MTRQFGMPETPKGRKGWKQNSNGKPNNWALNWSPSNSRLHNDPIQRGGVPWKPRRFAPRSAIHANHWWALLTFSKSISADTRGRGIRISSQSSFVGTARVADADFVIAQSTFGDFSRDLRFKSEAVLLQFDRLDYFPAESLVTGLMSLRLRSVRALETVPKHVPGEAEPGGGRKEGHLIQRLRK